MRAGTPVPSRAGTRTISGRIQGKERHSSVGVVVRRSITSPASVDVTNSSAGRSASENTTASVLPSGEGVASNRPSPSTRRVRPEPSKPMRQGWRSNGDASVVCSRKASHSSGISTDATSHSPDVRARRPEPSAATVYRCA